MRDCKRSFSFVYAVAAFLCFPLLGADGGCGSGGDVPIGRDDASVLDAGGAPDAGVVCALPGGGTCAAGTSCPAGDGCNTCSCDATGRALCTERACPLDAGAPDAGTCGPATCGHNPFGAPNYVCPDGSVGGPTCGVRSDGTCGWYIRSCPPAVDAGAADAGHCVETVLCIRGDHWDSTLCRCVPDVDAGAADAGHCVETVLCIRGDHWDSTLCRCVPDVDAGAVDAGVADAGHCVETVLCIRGDHWDSTLCRCVPDADAGSPIVCSAGGGGSFPTFARSCSTAADCTTAVHQTDCCGNSRAMGIAASQRAAFDAAEAICAPMYPRCGCPARPPVADDGMTSTATGGIAVDCRAGVCTTYVH